MKRLWLVAVLLAGCNVYDAPTGRDDGSAGAGGAPDEAPLCMSRIADPTVCACFLTVFPLPTDWQREESCP